ncbi:Protein of unknown function, partial [Gryllus bimaculatus]
EFLMTAAVIIPLSCDTYVVQAFIAVTCTVGLRVFTKHISFGLPAIFHTAITRTIPSTESSIFTSDTYPEIDS